MSKISLYFLSVLIVLASSFGMAYAEDISLLPKYGAVEKTEDEKAADIKFIAAIEELYKGDLKKASVEISARGWQLLRSGKPKEGMRRFNQAWLLDNANGVALWGMAAAQANLNGKFAESLPLFAEADSLIVDNADFSADYARAVGMAGAQSSNQALLEDAFRRFAQLYEKYPQHTQNLQNWAIILFYVGNYAEAWKKIQLAEATPKSATLDQNFITALQSKMPRPHASE